MKYEISLPSTIEESHRMILSMQEKLCSLEQSVEWFKKVVFGSTSERRKNGNSDVVLSQCVLPGIFPSSQAEVVIPKVLEDEQNTNVCEPKGKRGKSRKQPLREGVGSSGLRFTDEVPIEVVEVPVPEIIGLREDEYEIIGYEENDRLAQKKSSFFIKRIRRPIVRLKELATLVEPAMPPLVIPGSYADESFLVGMILDKILYHSPLYRTYQRLYDAGIRLSRSTLTNYFHTVGDLLEVVFHYHVLSLLEKATLTMDETTIKAGRDSGAQKMNLCYFWTLSNQANEVAFLFYDSREYKTVQEILGNWLPNKPKVLLTDDYGAYTAYAKCVEFLIHALCWSHARRKFIDAENSDPLAAGVVIAHFAKIYKVEADIRKFELEGERKLQYRRTYSAPLVDELFSYLKQQRNDTILLPGSPYGKAINYTLDNESGMRIFLSHSDVPIDTNHLERQNKMVGMGRKNYLFCSTEIGAHYLGIFYSLILSAKALGLDPREYLTDVLRRVKNIPTEEIRDLAPLRWKLIRQQDAKPITS